MAKDNNEVRIGSRSFEKERQKEERNRNRVEVEVERRDDRPRTGNYCRIEFGMDEVYELTQEQKKEIIESVLKHESVDTRRTGNRARTENLKEEEELSKQNETVMRNSNSGMDNRSEKEDYTLENSDEGYQGPLDVRQRIVASFFIGLLVGAIVTLILSV